MAHQADSRKSAYKSRSTFQADELRRRREEQTVEIRRQKREESLTKRRNFNMPEAASDSEDDEQGSSGQEQLQELFPPMIASLYSDNLDEQLTAVTKFRKLLSKERCPPIEEVIECGVVPRFVELLRSSHSVIQ
ncbi:Importin subunit alpha-1, partial [Coemansia sp. RSA 532]